MTTKAQQLYADKKVSLTFEGRSWKAVHSQVMSYAKTFSDESATSTTICQIPPETNKIDPEVAPITDLNLDVRSINCLKNAGIDTVKFLLMHNEAQLLGLKNFGKRSLKSVRLALHEVGLSLSQHEGDGV